MAFKIAGSLQYTPTDRPTERHTVQFRFIRLSIQMPVVTGDVHQQHRAVAKRKRACARASLLS